MHPKFEWSIPNDWSTVLFNQHLKMNITCHNNQGRRIFMPYDINSFNDPKYAKPNFELLSPIKIPFSLWNRVPAIEEFPIEVTIEITSKEPTLKFDVKLITNESL
jgi:hypothetical protein